MNRYDDWMIDRPTDGLPDASADTKTHPLVVNTVANLSLLDAAKMPYILTSQLAASGLRYQSLFQGPTSEDLKERAPYLVELEKDNALTQKLFTGTKGVNGLWAKELGLFLQSEVGFGTLRKHVRKFTRIRDADGKWMLLRFWDPSFAEAGARHSLDLFQSIFSHADRVLWAWDHQCLHFTDLSRRASPSGVPPLNNNIVSPRIAAALSEAHRDKTIIAIAETLWAQPNNLPHATWQDARETLLRWGITALQRLGLGTQKYLKTYLLFRATFPNAFEYTPHGPAIENILLQPISEQARMTQLSHYLEAHVA